jgi:hypothetical protein
MHFQGDFPASKMLNGFPGVDPARRAKLMEVLDINPDWRMHTVSDGQRRRVQICLGLLKPFDVLLLDEITVDLDVLGRADLMQFLKEECDQRGATIIYVGCPSCCISHQSQSAGQRVVAKPLILYFGICTDLYVVVILTCVPACSLVDTRKHHKCAYSQCPTCLLK